MVIELCGVQFGLKPYASCQNQTSAQREFHLKLEVWFQTKISQHEDNLPLYYIAFEIENFNRWNIVLFIRTNTLLIQFWAGL